MSSLFLAVTDSGRTLFATLQQLQPNGTLGDYWDVTNGQWAPVVAINDRKIPLVEGGLNDLGRYTGGTGQLGSYTGLVIKSIHDTGLSNRVIGTDIVYVLSGVEQRFVVTNDISGLPLAVRTELNANPVPASNMRGTDSAMLAASYVAPDNATIVAAAASAATAASQATTAAAAASTASVAAVSLDTVKITTARAVKLDFLDAAISTRSTLTAGQVQAELTSNPVPSSNMRGTDNALLAASYTAPNNAGITTAATQASAAATSAASVDTKITPTRAGYLDNLSGGAVALQSTVNAITNSTRVKLSAASQAIIPDAGSTPYAVDLLLFDTAGNMEAPDATPTFTAANQTGTDRSANLSAVSMIGTGHYRASYTVANTHAAEQILISANVVEGGQTLIGVHVMPVVTAAEAGGAGGFTSGDRAKLDGIFGKLPSKAYLTATAASDGDIDLDDAIGDRDQFKADVSALATAAAVAAVPAATKSYIDGNGGVVSSNMRGTDAALLAVNYTAPNNSGIATAATQATAAAASAATASSEATLAKTAAQSLDNVKITTTRAAKLDFLDAAITTRSTFNSAVDLVTLAPGHGLATSATQLLIKAKTDNLPSQPAAASDVPTAAQVATQVNNTLDTLHPNWAQDILPGDATIANQNAILAAIGVINPSPPSGVQSVHEDLTWTLQSSGDDPIAPQVISVAAGSTVVVAMSFAALLNLGTGISLVSAVTSTPSSTITEIAPSQDRRFAHFKIAGLTAGTQYKFKVTIATTDGQTLVGYGLLRAE